MQNMNLHHFFPSIWKITKMKNSLKIFVTLHLLFTLLSLSAVCYFFSIIVRYLQKWKKKEFSSEFKWFWRQSFLVFFNDIFTTSCWSVGKKFRVQSIMNQKPIFCTYVLTKEIGIKLKIWPHIYSLISFRVQFKFRALVQTQESKIKLIQISKYLISCIFLFSFFPQIQCHLSTMIWTITMINDGDTGNWVFAEYLRKMSSYHTLHITTFLGDQKYAYN